MAKRTLKKVRKDKTLKKIPKIRKSRKTLKKQRKKSRKTLKKQRRKSRKSKKNIKLFGGAVYAPSSPAAGGDGGGGGAPGSPGREENKQYYLDLLMEKSWYPENRISKFLDEHLDFTGLNATQILEKKKEVRIAAFTNFYRDNIYALVELINGYLQPFADVVVSGGDGLNNNLDTKNRLISPDIDVKVIIKHSSVRGNDWLNLYKHVVNLTEYIVDFIVCCMNGVEKTNFKINPKLPKPPLESADYLRTLFYKDGEPFNFAIFDKGGVFNCLLNHQTFEVYTPDYNTLGLPWGARTSNMKAGGHKPPYTLNNVKLIAIDLRYVGRDYFSSLAGILDIVIAVPGHIGHNGMLGNYYGAAEFANSSVLESGKSINCITLNYYIYEMIQMIKYGLRTKNGKLIKDLMRALQLAELKVKGLTKKNLQDLINESDKNIPLLRDFEHPEGLILNTTKVLNSLRNTDLMKESAEGGGGSEQSSSQGFDELLDEIPLFVPEYLEVVEMRIDNDDDTPKTKEEFVSKYGARSEEIWDSSEIFYEKYEDDLVKLTRNQSESIELDEQERFSALCDQVQEGIESSQGMGLPSFASQESGYSVLLGDLQQSVDSQSLGYPPSEDEMGGLPSQALSSQGQASEDEEPQTRASQSQAQAITRDTFDISDLKGAIEVSPNYPQIEPKTISELKAEFSEPYAITFIESKGITALPQTKKGLVELYQELKKFPGNEGIFPETTNYIQVPMDKPYIEGDIIHLRVEDEDRDIYLRLNKDFAQGEILRYLLPPYGKFPITSSKLLELLNIADFLRQCEDPQMLHEEDPIQYCLNLVGTDQAYITILPYNDTDEKYYLKLNRHFKQDPDIPVHKFFKGSIYNSESEETPGVLPTEGTNYEYLQKNPLKDVDAPLEDGGGGDDPLERKRSRTSDDDLYDLLTNPPYVLKVESIAKANDLVEVNGDGTDKDEGKRFNPMRILTSESDALIAADILHTITHFLTAENIGYLAQFRNIKNGDDDSWKDGQVPIITNSDINAIYVSSLLSAFNGLLHKEKLRKEPLSVGHKAFYDTSQALKKKVLELIQ